MYAIKMEGDKTLIITTRIPVYRGDENCDVLALYLPAAYDEISIADCTVFLNYILPNAEEISEINIGIPKRLYKGYLVYETDIDKKFTTKSGEIELWLDFKDGLGMSYFRSSSTTLDILPNGGMDEYITQDDLDEVVQKVEHLEKIKADNITYDEDTGELQLSSNGNAIGDVVVIESSGGEASFDFNLISGGGATGASGNVLNGGDADGE